MHLPLTAQNASIAVCQLSSSDHQLCLFAYRLLSVLANALLPFNAGSHDKDTLMAASIAELLFSGNRSEGEAYNAYIVRIKALYHKQVLVPLRRCLDVPEVSTAKLALPVHYDGKSVCM